MSLYNKVSPDMKFVEREKAIGEFWKKEQIFQKSVEDTKGKESYVFYDGPPTANGKPHIGHVLTRCIKDLIPRYHAMKGEFVPRKAGWDTHGLPVELEVEKKLGIDGKEQIEAYGLEPFIKECKESVWTYKGMWEDFSDTVGFWADMENPYITYDNNFIESEWWALKKIYDRGLLYKGHRIVPYCPRCGTALSTHEVAQGYQDVVDETLIAKFKIKGEKGYFLAWTTTPWTLPSNVALCVNPKETYIKVDWEGEYYILAEALADVVFSGTPYEILETYVGKDLEYKEYEPLFGELGVSGKAWFVTCADYVTLTDGTGIVHIAPAFGEDDSKVGHKYDLPFVQYVDEEGKLTKETPWAGVFVKDADKLVIEELRRTNLLFATMPVEHSYPHCWRCDTPLIYYARDSWFIKMTEVRDDLIANNNTINWVPENIGKGRFGDWIANVQDWNISRDRYWGTPLNIWECSCGHRHAIGGIEELKSMSDDCPENIELHRPYIDNVHIKCEKCGGKMQRVEEVIDCWFDSGSMPFAQHHYPFENQEIFESQFPAKFISEAVDQTRGWFYSLLAISTLIFNKAPFENVIVLGHVQDKHGRKMSKHLGNAVSPFDALNTHGADAIRWYFYSNGAPWIPTKFNDDYVVEGQRKFLGTLWNTYAFYVLYANIDGFNPKNYTLNKESLGVMDQWILSRLNSTIEIADKCLGDYKIPETAKVFQSFVEELSNWYVRRCRSRFWAKGMEEDKINAYMTLYTCLVEFSKAAAPMIPFMTEEIYQNLVRSVDVNAPMSIHLCDYPKVEKDLMNPALEESMDKVLQIVTLGRAARNNASVKNRQPVAHLYVQMEGELEAAFLDVIKDELNVKEVLLGADTAQFTDYAFKPQLKTVGPKYGKLVGTIRQLLQDLDGKKAYQELMTTQALVLEVEGESIRLGEEDLLIETRESGGYITEETENITVVLDTNLTPELVEEGLVRELVSKIQTMRKEAGFDVVDHIVLYMEGNDALADCLLKNQASIQADTLSDEVVVGQVQGYQKSWDINGQQVILGVVKKG